MEKQQARIILLSEVLESKIRKEQELEYYQKELLKIQERIGYLTRELDLTKLIIDMIEHEKVKDLQLIAKEENDE
jgi:hypothetical protein